MTEPQTEFDSPWKDIIQIYFQDFIRFFFPYLHPTIDWTKPVEFLDKELIQVTRDAKIGRRLADALIKVYRTNGKESWLYIHIEVQNQPQSNFPQRMYIYNYKIYDQFKCPIESLAVLGDDDINWRPDHFNIQAERTRIRFDFSIVKLLDYRERWSELEADRNPFATVVMVHIKALDTRNNRGERKEAKLALIKRLYEQGFERQDIINLYAFIDWVMTLLIELQAEFNREITEYEEQKKMRYITSIERSGELKGKLLQTQQIVKRQLNRRVGEIDASLIQQLEALPIEVLEDLTEALLDFSSVSDLEEWLQSRPTPTEA